MAYYYVLLLMLAFRPVSSQVSENCRITQTVEDQVLTPNTHGKNDLLQTFHNVSSTDDCFHYCCNYRHGQCTIAVLQKALNKCHLYQCVPVGSCTTKPHKQFTSLFVTRDINVEVKVRELETTESFLSVLTSKSMSDQETVLPDTNSNELSEKIASELTTPTTTNVLKEPSATKPFSSTSTSSSTVPSLTSTTTSTTSEQLSGTTRKVTTPQTLSTTTTFSTSSRTSINSGKSSTETTSRSAIPSGAETSTNSTNSFTSTTTQQQVTTERKFPSTTTSSTPDISSTTTTHPLITTVQKSPSAISSTNTTTRQQVTTEQKSVSTTSLSPKTTRSVSSQVTSRPVQTETSSTQTDSTSPSVISTDTETNKVNEGITGSNETSEILHNPSQSTLHGTQPVPFTPNANVQIYSSPSPSPVNNSAENESRQTTQSISDIVDVEAQNTNTSLPVIQTTKETGKTTLNKDESNFSTPHAPTSAVQTTTSAGMETSTLKSTKTTDNDISTVEIAVNTTSEKPIAVTKQVTSENKSEPSNNATSAPSSDHGNNTHGKKTEYHLFGKLSGSGIVVPAALIAALSFGVLFLFAVLVLVGKRFFDSWQRRHYSRIDYLVNGMYN